MEVALIAPNSLLGFCVGRRYQMMLPDCVHGNYEYRVHYRFFGLNPAYYVILDNGAWETQAFEPEHLMRMAESFRVQEIVAPDVMSADPVDTLEVMNKFFARVKDWEYPADWTPTFAAVVHGRNQEEAMSFIDEVAETYPQATTISLAKVLPRDCADKDVRIKLARYVAGSYPDRFECHLLGYNEEFPDELTAPARSIDATTPFTSALDGYGVFMNIRVPRTPNYFALQPSDFDIELVMKNIDLFEAKATGRNIQRSWVAIDNL